MQGEMVKGDGRWERGMGKRGRTREEVGLSQDFSIFFSK